MDKDKLFEGIVRKIKDVGLEEWDSQTEQRAVNGGLLRNATVAPLRKVVNEKYSCKIGEFLITLRRNHTSSYDIYKEDPDSPFKHGGRENYQLDVEHPLGNLCFNDSSHHKVYTEIKDLYSYVSKKVNDYFEQKKWKNRKQEEERRRLQEETRKRKLADTFLEEDK